MKKKLKISVRVLRVRVKSRMKVLDVEKNIGIKAFITPFKGIGGKLRTVPEDFVVHEVSSYPPNVEDGKYVIAKVTAVYWETNLLIRELSKELHISRQRIGFAGTKDKRAKTTRLMSFYNIPLETLSNVKLRNVMIEDIYRSDRPVRIGDLFGNKFEIIIRGLSKDVELKHVQEIASYLLGYGGFPNFFGVQRFGIVRPISHIVGKHIIKGDFEKAVMSYIANPMEGEDKEIFVLRGKLQETRDYAEALKSYPFSLYFEKAVLNKLVSNPSGFVDALKVLPRNLLTMFVYSYQSYLFNRVLSERIKKGIPLNEAVVGDIVYPIRRGVIEERCIKVKKSNLEKVNKQVSKGKGVVTGLLFGYDPVFSDGEMGEIEHSVIESEKINPRDFIVPDIPFVSSSGSRRALLASVKKLDFKLINDEINQGKQALFLKFELNKGCYATCLLREFMKADDIRNY